LPVKSKIKPKFHVEQGAEHVMNNGKRFELEIKNSIPSSVYYYRFRDGTANFSGDKNQNVRFQATNMCDCLLYDSKHLYFLELKTHKGKSLPLSAIRENQIEQLDKAIILRE